MSGPQIPALAKPFLASLAEAIRLFSFSSPQSENRAYLSPSNSPPAPVIDKNLPHERYSDAVKQLRPLFPPACPWLQPGDVKIVGNVPVNAEGFADIWEGTLDDRSVLQKSYRCYESCDIERIFQAYFRELWVSTQLSHPNVVPVVGIDSTPYHPFALVLDGAGHLGLREYLHQNPEADRLKLTLGIARGLQHMHDLGIFHGQLTPQNIFIGPDGTPRITGFGSSFAMAYPGLWSDGDIVGFHRGSAPELIRPHKLDKTIVRATRASDMYAFGMLTWEIFAGKTPFSGYRDATVICRVLEGDRPSRPDHAELSDRVWKIVETCWSDSPSNRMAVGKVVALLEAE